MADFDDLDLRRPGADPSFEPPPRRFPWFPILIVIAVLLGGALAWYYWARPAAEPLEVRVETEEPVETPAPAARLPAEPGEDIELPPLDESDALVRELVSRLSSHPRTAAWLATDHVIRGFVASVVNIAAGDTPAPLLRHVPPEGEFQVREEGGRPYIDPRSYRRYDGYATAVTGLDARGAARLYATLKPRLEEAYQELGAPDGTFDRTLEKAIVRLLQTPVVEGDVPLEASSVAYSFADPRLESLSPAQRQFLRMGPGNMRLVQAKLREIAGHLGIPPESLPEERVMRARR